MPGANYLCTTIRRGSELITTIISQSSQYLTNQNQSRVKVLLKRQSSLTSDTFFIFTFSKTHS